MRYRGIEEDEVMSQEFSCREPNCSEKVYYERKVLPAGVELGISSQDKKVVYLTCARGHTHPYEVSAGD